MVLFSTGFCMMPNRVLILCVAVQAEHNLRKLSESSYWQYEQARLNFWHSCNASFNREKVDSELAAEFFEVSILIQLLYLTHSLES